mgnify:CR=1 FL=1
MSFELIKTFENKIAEFFGSPYAVAVDCCTHGVELCLRRDKVKPLTYLIEHIYPFHFYLIN